MMKKTRLVPIERDIVRLTKVLGNFQLVINIVNGKYSIANVSPMPLDEMVDDFADEMPQRKFPKPKSHIYIN